MKIKQMFFLPLIMLGIAGYCYASNPPIEQKVISKSCVITSDCTDEIAMLTSKKCDSGILRKKTHSYKTVRTLHAKKGRRGRVEFSFYKLIGLPLKPTIILDNHHMQNSQNNLVCFNCEVPYSLFVVQQHHLLSCNFSRSNLDSDPSL